MACFQLDQMSVGQIGLVSCFPASPEDQAMKRVLPLVAVLLLAPPEFSSDFRFAGVARGQEPVEAFLAKHCVRCHGPEKKKGELRIDKLSRDFNTGADTQHWAEVIERINSGEMPPKNEPKPTQDE